MPTFIAFLRAVNVGKRQYPMAELRDALTAAGFEKVETHIQTGNVVFRTSMRSRPKVIAALEKAMLADRGFAVPVVLMTPQELSEIYDEACDFGGGKQLQGHYLTLLAAAAERGGGEGARGEVRRRRGGQGRRAGGAPDAEHRPYHEATTGNAEVERHLGVATTRNLTVITKLTEKWGS